MNWFDFAAGLVLGVVASGLFFAGLGLGVRLAMGSKRPGLLLLASAGVRIALLLLAGWAAAGIGVSSLAGFAAGFLMVRLVTITSVRTAGGEGS